MLPSPVFWPGEFHGLYSAWDGKEVDTTERFSHTQCKAGPTSHQDSYATKFSKHKNKAQMLDRHTSK